MKTKQIKVIAWAADGSKEYRNDDFRTVEEARAHVRAMETARWQIVATTTEQIEIEA